MIESTPGSRLSTPAGLGAGPRKPKPGPALVPMGKVPPQAVDVEQAVLGGLMLQRDALAKVIDVLKPEVFYKEAHRLIFEAITQLWGSAEPIDVLTVAQQLRKNGTIEIVGGAYYLTELTSRVASAANIEFHARYVAEKYLLRELIRISGEVQRDAYDESSDVFDLLDHAESQLFQLAETNLKRDALPVGALIPKTIRSLEEMRDRPDGLTGIPTGFDELDKMTSGWQKTDLVIVAARPAMGKTAFALSMARTAAVKNNVGVAFFSLEMAAPQIAHRLLSAEAELELNKLRNGKLEAYEWQQLTTRSTRLRESPFIIDDTPALSVYDLRAKCRRLKAEKGIQMVIVDYLQLMTAPNVRAGNREQEIAYISRSLKELAKELDVVMIALSQLSREVEKRGTDKRPQLSDLRESGAIEQDADIVAFLYRPEVYNLEVTEDGRSTRGMGEVIIGKQRNGPIGRVEVAFEGHFARFGELSTSGGSTGGRFVPYSGGSSSADPAPFRPYDGATSDDSPAARIKKFQSRMNDDTLEGGFDPGPAPF